MQDDECKLQNANCKMQIDAGWLRDSPFREGHFSFFILRFAFCILFPAFFLDLSSAALAADARKVVIPFDFVSKFDDGRYGQMVGEMIWKKLSVDGGFIVPESMLDVRDYCESHKLRPSPEMDLDKIKQIVADDFGGQIGIWGSVERAPGGEGEVYDIVLKCVDFSAKLKPKVIYDVKARTKSVSEIPHLYVKAMLDVLAGKKPEGGASVLTVDNGWQKNKNLVAGDFEQGIGGVPKGWDKVAGQQREPLGWLVRWTTEKGNPANKVIRFTLDRDVAENEGVMYYSDFFPVQEGATYRFQCRWRSTAPAAKVFIKCYDADESGRRREVYRSQQNLKGLNDRWNTQTEDFTPKHTKYSPKWGRVMLYAYLNPGEVEFDDVVVKQVSPAPSAAAKVRRHSSESKITVKEMEEDRRRSGESKRGGE
jgi:hypothetical protein